MFVCSNYLSSNLPARQQTGAVLILALLIVAMVAGLGIKFAGDYQLGLARAEGRWHGAQARAYGYGAESAAIQLLNKEDDPAYDAPNEVWHYEFPIEVDGGGLLVTITDASAKFNLNALVGTLDPAKGPQDPTRYTAQGRMFIRLLRSFPELVRSTEEAAGIFEAIVDWTDPDNMPSGLYGAEEDYYLSRPDPYRPANAPFRSLEELQLVRGITPELMKAIRPYITVLNTITPLNINTMDVRMFRTINAVTDLEPIDASQAEALQKTVPKVGYYLQPSEFDATWNAVFGSSNDYDKSFLTVKTDFFWLTTQAVIGQQRRTARSLLKRSPQGFSVVQRDEVY